MFVWLTMMVIVSVFWLAANDSPVTNPPAPNANCTVHASGMLRSPICSLDNFLAHAFLDSNLWRSKKIFIHVCIVAALHVTGSPCLSARHWIICS
jgi:hypothetical protein